MSDGLFDPAEYAALGMGAAAPKAIAIVSSEDAAPSAMPPVLRSAEGEDAIERAWAILDGRMPLRAVPDAPEHMAEVVPLSAYAQAVQLPDPGEEEAPVSKARGAIEFKHASEIAAKPTRSEWLLRPYLERNVLALMYGEFGTLKSFAALEMALTIASGQASMAFPEARVHHGNVIYISAEGKGLWRRLRGWSIARGIGLETVNFWGLERPVDTFSEDSLLELAESINALVVTPDLIVIDTLSRNAGAADESKTADMTAYLNGLDKMLRVPFGCTVLLVHHVGHAAKDRARGSYVLMANTDANYLIERPDSGRLLIELKTGRLKDSESPPAACLMGRVIELGTHDEDGKPETTLVLDSTLEVAPTRLRSPTGKNQRRALDVIRAAVKSGETLLEAEAVRRVREACEMPRERAYEAVKGLIDGGYIKHGAMGPLEIVGEK